MIRDLIIVSYIILIIVVYNHIVNDKLINIEVNNFNSILIPLPCTQSEIYIKNEIENIMILKK